MDGKDINNMAYTLGGNLVTIASIAACIVVCSNPAISDNVKLGFIASGVASGGAGAFVSTREIKE